MTELLRGAPVARAISEGVRRRAEALRESGTVPALALVRVGASEDDLSYERAALRRAEKVGVEVRRIVLPADCSQGDLDDAIRGVNGDRRVHGCLVFRPLPGHLDQRSPARLLDPAKDVDGITGGSLLGVFTGRGGGFAPCTAEAVVEILERSGERIEGARVTVVGRSLVVGRPLAMMLMARNATVTICHTRTADVSACCREADIVVACAGAARFIGRDCMRPGQCVVDVGINWDEREGRLVGDVDEAAAEGVVRALTPVPGGVGAVTTSVLMEHVVRSAESAAARDEGLENPWL